MAHELTETDVDQIMIGIRDYESSEVIGQCITLTQYPYWPMGKEEFKYQLKKNLHLFQETIDEAIRHKKSDRGHQAGWLRPVM